MHCIRNILGRTDDSSGTAILHAPGGIVARRAELSMRQDVGHRPGQTQKHRRADCFSFMCVEQIDSGHQEAGCHR
jgi:hypothetical protein